MCSIRGGHSPGNLVFKGSVSHIAAPPTSVAGEEEDDATYKRCPTGYDPKGLLFDMTERGKEPNM